mmetsp:Transcript_19013/g.47231  ORF Transcript_19013/g.47231 Transcript_19013/m.47231 type:complete len:93 (-) Transcript_19013:504-782(-)
MQMRRDSGSFCIFKSKKSWGEQKESLWDQKQGHDVVCELFSFGESAGITVPMGVLLVQCRESTFATATTQTIPKPERMTFEKSASRELVCVI